jgi:hypothetical protein
LNPYAKGAIAVADIPFARRLFKDIGKRNGIVGIGPNNIAS